MHPFSFMYLLLTMPQTDNKSHLSDMHLNLPALARVYQTAAPSLSLPHLLLRIFLPSALLGFILLQPLSTFGAEPYFVVTAVEGNARVQRAIRKSTEQIAANTRILNNDIVESFFQARTSLQFGTSLISDSSGIAILGPNSKALVNITERVLRGTATTQTSFSVFAGGLYVKTNPPYKVTILTTNGIAEMDSGIVSVVVDSKSNESGFQVLAGSIRIRNIAQQNSKPLPSGMTTMILPGREPTAPLYLTNRHVAVLKMYFGEDAISQDLKASSITPTEEVASNQRLKLSDNAIYKRNQQEKVENLTYKRLFSLERIYESIIKDQNQNNWLYEPIAEPWRSPLETKGELVIGSNIAFAASSVYPLLTISPRYHWGKYHIGVNLPLSTNYQNEFGVHNASGSAYTLLGFIDHAQYGYTDDSLFVRLGALKDYTMGNGIIVSHLNNRNPYSTVQPLALYGKAGFINGISFNGFIGDISDFTYGGFLLNYQPSTFSVNAGYYYDFNQLAPLKKDATNRFIASYDSTNNIKDESVQIMQAGLGVDVISRQQLLIGLNIDLAGRLGNKGGGLVFRAPALKASFSRTELGLALLIESGQLMSNQFSWFYPINRNRFIDTTLDSTDLPIPSSQNSFLHPKRMTRGLEYSLGYNPSRRSSVSIAFKHDFYSRYTPIGDSISVALVPDYDYSLRIALKDSVIPYIRYGELYIAQAHLSVFPATGTFFSSWGLHAGLHLQSVPFQNFAVKAGLEYYMLDLSEPADNKINATDNVIEASIGVQWGFL